MKNKKDGFTLVELVIVIAIIAILAAILVPTFSSVITSARKTADIEQMKHVNLMLLSGEIDKTHLKEYVLQTEDWELAYSGDNNNVVIVEKAYDYLDDIIAEAESKNLVGENADKNGYIRVSELDFADDNDSADPAKPDLNEGDENDGDDNGDKNDPNGGEENNQGDSGESGDGDDSEGGDDQPEEPEHEHNMVPVKAKEATCTEDGNEAYYECPDCEKFFLDEEGKTEVSEDKVIVPATGHTDMEHIEAKEATCTEAGNYEYYKCSVCNKLFSDNDGNDEIDEADITIPAGHSYGLWQADEDEHWKECSSCGDKTERGTHNFGEDNKCSVCEHEKKIEQGEWDFVILDNDDLIAKADEINAKKESKEYFTVYLGDDVKDIGGYFKANEYLTRIYLGSEITKITKRAFSSCTALEEVIIAGNMETIEEYTFSGCAKLTAIKLSEGLHTIGDYAFKGCTALEKLVIPQSVKEFGVNTFSGCNFIELTIPCAEIDSDSIEKIDTTVENLIINNGKMGDETSKTSDGFTTWLSLLIDNSTEFKSLTIYETNLSDSNGGITMPFGKLPDGTKIIIDEFSYGTAQSDCKSYLDSEKAKGNVTIVANKDQAP